MVWSFVWALRPTVIRKTCSPWTHPYVRELVDTASKLKDASAGGRSGRLGRYQEMSRLETTLRAYCEEDLTGQRAEETLPSMIEEPPPTEG